MKNKKEDRMLKFLTLVQKKAWEKLTKNKENKEQCKIIKTPL